MREILVTKAPFALALGMASALMGCPNPNSYATPRTVDPGRVAHSVAIEGFGYANNVPGDDPDTENVTETEHRVGGFLPTLPSYQIRIGVVDRFDIGVHVHNLSSLGADFKYNPLKGVFDLAIDPGFQWFTISANDQSAHIFYFHAPLMMAVNPTEWFTIILTPGFTYGLFSGDLVGDDADQTISGSLFRGSLGFQFRIGDRFAIHPEFSIMKSLEGSGTLFNAGIGFNFGSIPGYKDLIDPAEQPERPPSGGAPPPGGMPPPGYALPPGPAPMPAAPPPT